MRISTIGGFTVLGCLIGGQVQAAPSYSYVADKSAYTATTGSEVAVDIFFKETGSPSVITNDGGLSGAGAGVNIVSTTGGSAAQIPGSSFTSAMGYGQPVAGTSVVYNQGNGAAANNLEFIEAIPQGTTDPIPDVNGKILLGTLKITVGAGSTTYILTSLNNDTINNGNSALGQSDGNTGTVTGHDLDSTKNSSLYTGADADPGFSFTVSPAPAPEPSSLLLCGLGIGGLLIRRRKMTKA